MSDWNQAQYQQAIDLMPHVDDERRAKLEARVREYEGMHRDESRMGPMMPDNPEKEAPPVNAERGSSMKDTGLEILKALDPIGGSLLHALGGATMGVLPAAMRSAAATGATPDLSRWLNKAEEADPHPVLSTLAGGLATGGSIAKSALGGLKGVLPRIAGSGVLGGLAHILSEGSDYTANKAEGGTLESPGDAATRVLSTTGPSTALGLGLGGLGEIGGAVARARVSPETPTGRLRRDYFAEGGKESPVLGRLKAPPAAARIYEESAPGEVPLDTAVDNVRGKVAGRATAYARGGKEAATRQNIEYQEQEADTKILPKTTVKLYTDLLKGRTYSAGAGAFRPSGRGAIGYSAVKEVFPGDLPHVPNQSLVKTLGQMTEPPKVIPSARAAGVEEAGGIVISVAQAKNAGLIPSAMIATPHDVVVLRPKAMNAQQLDQVITFVDHAAGLDKEASGGRPDPWYAAASQALRRDQEQLPANQFTAGEPSATVRLAGGEHRYLPESSYSAMKHRHGADAQKSSELLRALGVPNGDADSLNTLQGVGNQLRHLGSGASGHSDLQSALEQLQFLTGDQSLESGIRAVRGVNLHERMRALNEGVPGIPGSKTGAVMRGAKIAGKAGAKASEYAPSAIPGGALSLDALRDLIRSFPEAAKRKAQEARERITGN